MHLSDGLQQSIADARARVRVGYPWWLRPWMSRDVLAITLGRWIYLRPGMEARASEALERLLAHELVHVKQVNRLGLPVFLARYVGEFVLHLTRERSAARAYRKISFEIEANAAEERGDI